MSSEFDTLFTAVASPALNTAHGETVTHYPQGVVANAAVVTARVFLSDPVDNPDRGEGRTIRGTLIVADTVTVAQTDVWGLAGLKFKAEWIQPARAGERKIGIVYREETYTTTRARTLTGR